ncbi:pyridoxal-phosphate-dependent aminotransferase family protein [Alkalibacter saccharofermentans]|uniref:Aspartate aminotransferase n=1 Tax=Alkalibacter saccharofermentans DSM 14828 TaxID=1120975 RepID=A0A1M4ZTX9_9FIRM|nr:alanine--glyoxylate aminotransferase family protein [Alkalibacter saccharofermentans]SHF21066.1 aspartate aminotransferase [Alkalibacter saccharofermentans DSM 14828]
MKRKLVMTPGPTEISEDVKNAFLAPVTNPDLDLDFVEHYYGVCNNLKSIFNTQNDVLILNGEGILGLEASCASLIEPGDKVLCINNGIFGRGFGDFAKLYGADVTYYDCDLKNQIAVEQLSYFLDENTGFKLATLVHCETPSGITNPVDKLCPLLKRRGILTIVDSVSAFGGEPIWTDLWKMDVVIAGSQKCLSASPGLTILSISPDAWDAMKNRETPITGFYCNLLIWENWYKKKSFPYTQPESNIHQLHRAVLNVLEEPGFITRHENISVKVRKTFIDCDFELYAHSGFSNTVTTILLPKKVSFVNLFDTMKDDFGILIGGGFDFLENKIFRIGHMGENCHEEKIYLTLKALDDAFEKLGVRKNKKLHKVYAELD